MNTPHFLCHVGLGVAFVSEMTYTVSSGTLNSSIPYLGVAHWAKLCATLVDPLHHTYSERNGTVTVLSEKIF